MKNNIQSSFTSFRSIFYRSLARESNSTGRRNGATVLHIRLDFFNGIFTLEDAAMIQTASRKCNWRPINYTRDATRSAF